MQKSEEQRVFPTQIEFTYNNGVLTPSPPPETVFEIPYPFPSSVNPPPSYVQSGFISWVLYENPTLEWLNPDCYTNKGYPTNIGYQQDIVATPFYYTPVFQNLQSLPIGDYVFRHTFQTSWLDYYNNWHIVETLIFKTILHVTSVEPPPAETPTTFSPNELFFHHTKGQPLPYQNIAIEGSSWRIIGKVNFIFSTTTPGVVIGTNTDGSGSRPTAVGAGNAIIRVALGSYYETSPVLNPSDLETTFSVDDREFNTSEELKVKVIIFNLDDILTIPHKAGETAFTLDPKFYEVKTPNTDTFFQFDATIKTYDYLTHLETITVIHQKIIPFRGKGVINLGKIIHRLMHKINEVNEQELQYKIAVLQITCSEKKLEEETLVRSGTSRLIPYVAGLSRGITTAGFLDFNPKANRVTQNSFAYLNVLIDAPNYEIRVFRNGNLNKTIALPDFTEKIICVKIAFKDFYRGDFITYSLEKRGITTANAPKKEFILLADSFYSCHLVWENEFKLQSVLECTGTASIKTEFENLEQKLVENLVEITETVESSKEVKLTINTGWLLETDVDTVESLLRASRIWLLQKNRTIALRSKPKSIVNRDIDRALIEFTLEFTLNRTYDEETYTL